MFPEHKNTDEQKRVHEMNLYLKPYKDQLRGSKANKILIFWVTYITCYT